MKCLYTLFALVFLFSATSKSQDYTFRYNPYSGMNNDQLELALEQARKMERNGKVWTAVGSGMLVGGAVMTFNGLSNISFEEDFNYSGFGIGLVVMCFSAFPLITESGWHLNSESECPGLDTSYMFLKMFTGNRARGFLKGRASFRGPISN